MPRSPAWTSAFALATLYAAPARAQEPGELAVDRVGEEVAVHVDRPQPDGDGRWRDAIRPIGQLQVWTTVWDQDVSETADPATYGDMEADPGFQLYRARAGAEGRIRGPEGIGQENAVYWRVWAGTSPAFDAPWASVYGATPAFGIVDAFGRWDVRTGLGLTQLTLGLQTVQFNRERIMSSADLLFQERSVGGEWTGAARDTGLTASQTFQFTDDELGARVRATAGIYNGEVGSFLGNPSPGMMQLGRLEFELGDAYRTWDPEGRTAIGLGVAARNTSDVASKSQAYVADALVRVWYVSLHAEASTQNIAPGDTSLAAPDVLDGTTRLGGMTQLSVFVPFTGDQGLEIGGRYALFDDDRSEVTTGDVKILHAGATWRNPLRGVDVGAGFIHRMEAADVGPWANDTIRIWTQLRPDVATVR